jgi:hypothetical protein
MSEVKVNKISPRSGTTVTLGDSGDTFTIPSGATINNQGTATNFGATGSASWVTTVKTSTFTAVAGEGYFVNTTGGAVTVNLPAGTAGAVVAIKDYANTFDTNKVTLVQNGSDKIGGSTVNATLETEGIAVTLVFIDSTQGWLVTDSGLQSELPTAQYVTATGGSISTTGDFKVHTFTGPGTFCVSSAGNAAGSTAVDYIVVAGGGGGGGGSDRAAGGGAGGFRGSNGTTSGCYAAGCSPIVGPVGGVTVSVQGYPIVVGGGGAGRASGTPTSAGANGNPSSALSITSTAGGAGANTNGYDGGSGGGGGTDGSNPYSGGSGNTPPVSPSQGNNGGPNGSTPLATGGGGGIKSNGGTGANPGSGSGGDDINNSITGSPVYYAGGGGGGGQNGGAPSGAGSPRVDQDQQEGLLVVLLHTMQQMLLITEVVVAVELEIEVVVTQLVVEMVVQELLLLDTNFKINMYLLTFKINI